MTILRGNVSVLSPLLPKFFRPNRISSSALSLIVATAFFFSGFFFSGCAVPTSSLTAVNVTGQIFDHSGRAVSSKMVEVILPAEYGLNEIDLEQGSPESYGHSDQYAKVVTDSLGSFSVQFAPIEYSSAFWILPPLGTILSRPPEPKLYMSLPDSNKKYYSILLKESGALYGVYQSASGFRTREGSHSVPTSKPATLEAELLSDDRDGMKAWIANLEFKMIPAHLQTPANAFPSAGANLEYPNRARFLGKQER